MKVQRAELEGGAFGFRDLGCWVFRILGFGFRHLKSLS